MDFGEFSKVLELASLNFQDLRSFGEEKFFKMAVGKFWVLFGKILKYPRIDITLFHIKFHVYYIY